MTCRHPDSCMRQPTPKVEAMTWEEEQTDGYRFRNDMLFKFHSFILYEWLFCTNFAPNIHY